MGAKRAVGGVGGGGETSRKEEAGVLRCANAVASRPGGSFSFLFYFLSFSISSLSRSPF
jgi:hypothetical protein